MKTSHLALASIFTVFITPIAYASPVEGFAMVDDPDGYVNLRQADNLQSEVISKIPNDTMVSAYCYTYEHPSNFCFSVTDNGLYGYIYKNRLKFLKENENLVQVVKLNSSPVTADFVDDEYKVSAHIQLKPVTLYPDNLAAYNTRDEGCPDYYDDKCSYGLEGLSKQDNEPELYYEISDITFNVKGKTTQVPKQDLENIFTSEHFVSHNIVFTQTELYFDPSIQQVYLVSKQGDGAGVFSFIFTVDSAGKVTKHIWVDEV